MSETWIWVHHFFLEWNQQWKQNVEKVNEKSKPSGSINPLLQEIAGLERSTHLSGIHGSILGHVLGVLPLEELDAILGVRLTAEVAVCGSLLVLGLAKGQLHRNGTRSCIALNLQHVGDVVSSELAALGAIGLDEEGQWLGNTNGVRELNQAALGQTTLHNRLGHLTAVVCRRAIHLGGVLAGEGTATVGTPAAVSVNDDLAAGEASIALGTTNDELAGLDGAILLLHVLNGDLGLAIGAQPPQLTALAHIGQGLAKAGGHGVGQWHAPC